MSRIADARRAGFYPLMMLIERLAPKRPPIGAAGLPNEEVVRFRHDPALAFNTSDVLEVQGRAVRGDADPRAEDALYEITTTFLGLMGCTSPLPTYLSEELLQEDSDRTRDFLDLFHHRLLSLLYRGTSRYDVASNWVSDGSDAWSSRLLALVGFGIEGQARLPPWRLLRLSPLLNARQVTAAALQSVLADVLAPDLRGAAVQVEQFVGTWADLEPSEMTVLGKNANELGRSFFLGRRVFDRAGKFRVVIGPLSRDEYLEVAEKGDLVARIESVISTILSGALDYEIVLSLERAAAPSLQLSSTAGSRLGRNSWLGGQNRETRIAVPVIESARSLQCA
jgi:type VI secretion system protein ImpH